MAQKNFLFTSECFSHLKRMVTRLALIRITAKSEINTGISDIIMMLIEFKTFFIVAKVWKIQGNGVQNV